MTAGHFSFEGNEIVRFGAGGKAVSHAAASSKVMLFKWKLKSRNKYPFLIHVNYDKDISMQDSHERKSIHQ